MHRGCEGGHLYERTGGEKSELQIRDADVGVVEKLRTRSLLESVR
jgi:hypothetical protein